MSNIIFAGVNLKVIMGHPEHDLLFIAKQVADAAGLNNSSQVISAFVRQGGKGNDFMRLGELYNVIIDLKSDLISPNGKAYGSNTYLMTEPQAYKMLMRGHAPQSEPFRKWVTEEVLPTIRKTGRYDITKSNTEEAKQFSAEFAMLVDMMKAGNLIGYREEALEQVSRVE